MYGSMMMVQREKENLGLGSKFMIKEFMDVKEEESRERRKPN